MTIGVANFTGTNTISTTEISMINNSSTIATNTTVGMFQANIDFNAVAAGDVFEFKCYEKCRAGDTQRLVWSARTANVQTAPIWASPVLILGVGWDMTLKKISGTDRTINWSIRGVT